MISLTSPHVLPQVHDKLKDILNFLDIKLGSVTITSMHRPGDMGVHGTLPCRAADVRCRSVRVARAIAGLVNENFEYDHRRSKLKCALAHDAGTGMHVHLQVHENTRKVP